MHQHDTARWQHSHTFGTDQQLAGETRTRWVVALTFAMMVAEIAGGLAFGSMALLADGWHMATHAAALGVALFAYWYARRRASDRRYSFGTGKVGALGGFGSAVVLAVVAVMVMAESLGRLALPVAIRFEEAIAVAGVGLVVNLVSAWLLRGAHGHLFEHAHEHDQHHHHDHNLRGAYLHVLADALTSVLAIVALSAGRVLGWNWMDAATGVVGAVLIGRWSLGLLRDSGAVLLDGEVAQERRDAIRAAIERDADNRVTDLHVWRVGPSHLAAIVSLVTDRPRDPGHYKELLVGFGDIAHLTVEVHHCDPVGQLPRERASAERP
jgi:cation diffusion facilitator family transporter